MFSNHQEQIALPTLEHLLRYVPDPEQLTQIPHPAWPGYLVGLVFAERAKKKTSKSSLQTNKKLR